MQQMILTTTHVIQDKSVSRYLGIVSGEVVMGANVFRDIAAGIRNVTGGRTRAYEETLRDSRNDALREMAERAQELGANAVIGVELGYETVGQNMLMVTASGTAVVVG
jgi:uncharacterized protein YbjQ (UPF0145 family)